MRIPFARELGLGLVCLACGSESPVEVPGSGGAPGSLSAGTAGTGPSGGVSGSSSPSNGGSTSGTGTAGSLSIPVAGVGGAGGSGGGGEVCATETASAELEPVYLAIAFDVSGSMGKGDYPWHDATLKWDPVVAATRAFLEDPVSAGLQASMTVFPADADEDERCDPATYEEPDVAMTELPSTIFGETLDAIREDDWRGGTPTLAVVSGVLTSMQTYAEDHPGRYALVLVTDGYPQSCDDDEDDIEEIAEMVAGVADEIPTFVLGIRNPPLTDEDGEMAPDTVSDLVSIAEAGGTETAYLIDTGNPTQTSADFQTAVDRIRGAAISCNIAIPTPPGGRVFEKEKVIVSYTTGSGTTELHYDATCAGANGWHYDDIDNPKSVVLCDSTCGAVQADVQATLAVAFTCEVVIEVPR
jgi:hypothetical protein